jgi:uncharacterized RDD family membrane protein YckC
MVSDEVNPYAAPEDDLDAADGPPSRGEPLRLASHWQRLLGFLIDRTCIGYGASFLGNRLIEVPELEPVSPAIWFLPLAIVTALQSVLITLSGQSIGKRLVGTRIVRPEGAAAGFVRGALLREWLPLALFVFLDLGPLAGLTRVNLKGLVVVVDTLPIFGNDRRCLHDYLAGTIVVRARRQPQAESQDG